MVLYVGRLCGTAEVQIEIDTPSKRAKLKPRRNPYWQGVSGGRGGVSLGYRKPSKGPGNWIAKIVIDGARLEERIGLADDLQDADDALPYPAAVREALDWKRRQYEIITAQVKAGASAIIPTVGTAIKAYVAAYDQTRGTAPGRSSYIESQMKRHVLSDANFIGVRLARLRSDDIEEWRGKLSADLKSNTINRIISSVRAALNQAAEKHRRVIPGNISLEIKIGTRALPGSDNARRQLLNDAQIRRVIEEAYKLDEDFGHVVLLAAATGARFSQLARLKVEDVQRNRQRVLVPASNKGRGAKKHSFIAVPLSADIIDKIAPIVEGRDASELLLWRWTYKQVSSIAWEPIERRPWRDVQETTRYWHRIAERANLPPGTVMYALRHSSIVRSLNANLPIRLVAAMHDTSVEMIEKHYARHIIDATEGMIRKSLIALAPEKSSPLEMPE